MSQPFSISKDFKLGEVSFFSYRAQDSHGSCANIYVVNGSVVTYDEYWRKIVSVFKELDALEAITQAIENNKFFK